MRAVLNGTLITLLLATGPGCFFHFDDDRYQEDRFAYDRGPVDAFVARMGDTSADIAVTGRAGDDVEVRARLGASSHHDLDDADIYLDNRRGVVELVLRRYDHDVNLLFADVSVARHASLDLASGSGDIQVDGMVAPVHVDTGSGDVDVYTTDVVDLLTGSGDVRAAGAAGYVYTGSGDVVFTVDPQASGTLRLESGSGDVDVRLPRGLGVEIVADTGSGDVTIDAGGLYVRQDRRARVTINGGRDLVLEIESGSGDLTVRD